MLAFAITTMTTVALLAATVVSTSVCAKGALTVARVRVRSRRRPHYF